MVVVAISLHDSREHVVAERARFGNADPRGRNVRAKFAVHQVLDPNAVEEGRCVRYEPPMTPPPDGLRTFTVRPVRVVPDPGRAAMQ